MLLRSTPLRSTQILSKCLVPDFESLTSLYLEIETSEKLLFTQM